MIRISRDVRAPLVYGAGATGSLFAARVHEAGTKSRSGPEANAWPPCAVCGSDWRRASSLLEAGVDPARIAVGHIDTVPDDGYPLEPVRRVAYVVCADWEHRVLFGQDVCTSSGLAVNGGTGYTAPRGALTRAGLEDDQLHRITVQNPVEYPPPKPKCWPERWWPHCRWY
jgi:hypothetical protein